jgi:hypothetical protein
MVTDGVHDKTIFEENKDFFFEYPVLSKMLISDNFNEPLFEYMLKQSERMNNEAGNKKINKYQDVSKEVGEFFFKEFVGSDKK